jgi:hypothetical protein
MSVLDPTEAAERFVEKWSASELSERAASHEHFIDLCRLIGQVYGRRSEIRGGSTKPSANRYDAPHSLRRN